MADACWLWLMLSIVRKRGLLKCTCHGLCCQTLVDANDEKLMHKRITNVLRPWLMCLPLANIYRLMCVGCESFMESTSDVGTLMNVGLRRFKQAMFDIDGPMNAGHI